MYRLSRRTKQRDGRNTSEVVTWAIAAATAEGMVAGAGGRRSALGRGALNNDPVARGAVGADVLALALGGELEKRKRVTGAVSGRLRTPVHAPCLPTNPHLHPGPPLTCHPLLHQLPLARACHHPLLLGQTSHKPCGCQPRPQGARVTKTRCVVYTVLCGYFC